MNSLRLHLESTLTELLSGLYYRQITQRPTLFQRYQGDLLLTLTTLAALLDGEAQQDILVRVFRYKCFGWVPTFLTSLRRPRKTLPLIHSSRPLRGGRYAMFYGTKKATQP